MVTNFVSKCQSRIYAHVNILLENNNWFGSSWKKIIIGITFSAFIPQRVNILHMILNYWHSEEQMQHCIYSFVGLRKRPNLISDSNYHNIKAMDNFIYPFLRLHKIKRKKKLTLIWVKYFLFWPFSSNR